MTRPSLGDVYARWGYTLQQAPFVPPSEDISFGEQPGLTLAEIGQLIWRRKLRVMLSIIAALLFATIYLKNQTPLYTASMIVMPPSADQAARPASSGGGFGAQLLNGLGGSVQDDNFTRYLATYKTVSFADRLQDRYRLLQKLMPGRWDKANHRWLPPTGAMAGLRGALSEFFGLPPYAVPGAPALAGYLESNVRDSTLTASTMHRIAFKHPDPNFAVELLRTIHRESDSMLRDEAAAATTLKIARLQARIDATSQAEHRMILFGLLAEQQRRLMLLDPRLPFAAVIIDEPSASELPTSPRPLLTLVVAALAGTIAGIGLALLPDRQRPTRA